MTKLNLRMIIKYQIQSFLLLLKHWWHSSQDKSHLCNTYTLCSHQPKKTQSSKNYAFLKAEKGFSELYYWVCKIPIGMKIGKK